MGYYVRKLANRKTEPKWKIQYVSFKKADTVGSTTKYPKKEWDISKDRQNNLGFYKYMTLGEAKTRAKQLNAQLDVKRQEEKLIKIQHKNQKFQKRFDSALPEEFVADFEKRFIRKRDSEVDSGKRRTSRAMQVWRAAQKMIVSVAVEPTDWYFSTYEIYDYFQVLLV